MSDSSRPRIEPGLLAAISDGAPARLVRTLDKDPQLAERWSWQAGPDGVWRVSTESGETVELRPDAEGQLSDPKQVNCTCLLAPRCLHLLAVLGRLPLGEECATGRATAAPATLAQAQAAEPAVLLTPEQASAAASLERGAAELLEVGASAAGVRLQADLLRAVHDARCTGLHRAASAGTRLVRGIRDLREARPQFKLGTFAGDLVELLEVAGALGRAVASAEPVAQTWLGVARRAYNEIGNLRLYGVFCEPVLAGSGASGVQTTLVDGEGQLYAVSDVQPGEPGRARATYERGVRLGETSLSHRELCREGLFVQAATASADGRLGSGASVRAVRAEASSWDAPPIAQLFAVPLTDQLRRACASMALPLSERPAGSTLLFLRGQVLAASRAALLVSAAEPGEPLVRCLPDHDHAELDIQGTLSLLARAPGLQLRLIGRLRPEQPRSLALLAVGPGKARAAMGSSEPALDLPAEWRDRCNLGLDSLQASHLQSLLSRSVEVQESGPSLPDPLAPLRRRWQRLALGGRSTLPPEAAAGVEREARWLEERMLRNGAVRLRELLGAALSGERTLRGEQRRPDAVQLARQYLATGLYQRAFARTLEERSWLES